jgi:hypothetical protein
VIETAQRGVEDTSRACRRCSAVCYDKLQGQLPDSGRRSSRNLFAKVRLKPALRMARNAISAEPDNYSAARTEFSAKQFFADRPPSSTELLCRAAETDREAASLP